MKFGVVTSILWVSNKQKLSYASSIYIYILYIYIIYIYIIYIYTYIYIYISKFSLHLLSLSGNPLSVVIHFSSSSQETPPSYSSES